MLREETNDLVPPAVDGVDPDPDELVYGPLMPLEATYLVHGLLRVDPEGPGRKRPGHEKLLFFSVRVDQLIPRSGGKLGLSRKTATALVHSSRT